MVVTDRSRKFQALDGILCAIPVHVLCFDHDLICRYAAPSGPHFLGRSRDELHGQHVDRVFPDGLVLRPYLETVLHTNQPWQTERLPYPGGPNGAWPPGAWTVHAQPFAPPGDEPAEVPPAHGRVRSRLRVRLRPGVLVSCIERDEHGERSRRRGRARAEREAQLGASEAAGFVSGEAAERHRAAMLLERVRTKLTVIRGFTQLLRRRIYRAQPGIEINELTRITDAIGELDELLERYELSAPADT